jgi:putative transcriptional regulator
MPPKKPSRLTEALLETVEGQHRLGIMDDATYRKIRIRHLGKEANRLAQAISAEEIRALRERADLSPIALAIMLNMPVDYLSQLERGVKQPKGAALALLNIVRYRGIEAIL